MATYKRTGKKGNEKWNVIFDLPSLDGERKQKRLSGFDSRREAELAYIDYKSNYKAINKEPAKETFKTVFKRYLSYQETRVKESTYIDIRSNFELHVLPCFGDKVLIDIRPTDVITWQVDMNNKNYSFKYKNKLLGYIKMFFNYCIHIEEILSDSPAKRQLKFTNTKIKTEMLIYSPFEYSKFRSTISKKQDIILFDLLYFTGCRKGELIALKWQDFKDNFISITKTYSRKTKDGKWKLTTPKSKNSVRDVLLPDFLVKALIDLKQEKNAADSDFVLGNDSPTNERYLDHARDKYCNAVGIKKIRIHDFRHSHVSFLIGENIDILTIAKRLGDKVETILSTYAHLMPNKQAEMVAKLDNLVTKM